MAHSTASSDSVYQHIAITSYNYNSSENQFLYFSYLQDDDAQTASKRVLFFLMHANYDISSIFNFSTSTHIAFFHFLFYFAQNLHGYALFFCFYRVSSES